MSMFSYIWNSIAFHLSDFAAQTQTINNFTVSLAWTSSVTLPYFSFTAVSQDQLQFYSDKLVSTDTLYYRDGLVATKLSKHLLLPLYKPMLWNGLDSLLVQVSVTGGASSDVRAIRQQV